MATLEQKKSYMTERSVNSAAISPLMDPVVLGGSQKAIDITTRIGKFDT